MTATGESKPLTGKVALVAGSTRGAGRATAKVPHFCISESPTYTGRAVTALASDPQ